VRQIAVAAAALAVARFALEPWWLTRRDVEIRIPKLPDELEGLTIAQLSDFHRGPWVPASLLRRGVEAAMELKADLIALTGDFLSVHSLYAGSLIELLKGLHAPLGVYAVLGNHDIWVRGQKALQEGFRRIGIELLVNRAVKLLHRNTEFWVVGVDDWMAGSPDLEEALKGIPPGKFRLLLAHEPDFADQAALRGIPLQLSGHSHGGQFRLPGLGPVWLPPMGRKYPMGLYRLRGGTQVYTNVGLGVVSPPLRLSCRPELTHLTLRSAA
jgi:predicted MPP superfamily phosphohydrolase